MADDKPKIDLETIRHSTAHLMAQAGKTALSGHASNYWSCY